MDKARISRVLRFGRRFFVPGMRISAMRSVNPRARVTVIVPKTSDKRAVVRNKLRRRALEAMRPILPRFSVSVDVVVTIGKEATGWSFDDFRINVELLFKKITQSI